MKRYTFFSLLVGLLFSTSLIAQPLDEVPVHMMIETAEASLAIPDYYTALEWYENAYKETRDQDIAAKIGDLQVKLRDFAKAEKWLEKLVEADQGVKYPNSVFQYARVLKINGKYELAVEAFNFYAGLTSVNDSMLALADNEVAGIQLAMQSKPPVDLAVKNAGKGVNYSYTDASPTLGIDNRLYFASMRTREIITLDGKEGDYYLKIYASEKEGDGEWDTAKKLGEDINREGYHTGNPSITPDGSRMFFTRSVLTGNELTESKIFVTVSKGGNWGAPNELTGINGNWVAKQASPGQLFGKEVLFFSANIPGGFGGYDIYYATRIDDVTYDIPVNLGSTINSGGDEETPFHLNNKLYFSSTGLPGLGCLDIFRSDWDGAKWGKPENMGAGYNSSYDDFSFSVNETGKLGFLVSNRPDEESKSVKSKTCCDDIYQFEIRDIVIDLQASVYEGNVPLVGAKITLFELDRGKTGKSVQQINTQTHDFQFPLEKDKAYKILVERDGYVPAESPEFNTVGIVGNHTVTRTVKLTKKPAESTGTEIVTINEAIRLNNIYYDFDDDKILVDAEQDLEFLLKLMKKYPDMVIELSSHTDAQGNDAYNQRLSQRRAQSAKNFLTSRGISEKRIEAVGYGEANILNHCINGIDCTDDEHRYNRRTEFKILSGPTTIEVNSSDLGKQPKPQSTSMFPGNKGTTPASEPKIEMRFEKKLIDLGVVKKGEKREMDVNFINGGNVPIELELVTSCECTTLEWPVGKVFKPGEKGTIHAIFDSTDKEVGETTDIEIILKQNDPVTKNPKIYVVQYKFELVK
jgi:peptidoglycan-associated lipoprotein